jgi:hypothetical protein
MSILEVKTLKRENENVTLSHSLDFIQNHISSGKPLIIRGLLSEKESEHLIQYSCEISKNQPPSCPKVENGIPNYHRMDENIEKSKVKSILHLYTFFYWNKESMPVATYFRRLFKIRNTISNLPEDYALNNIQDGLISIPTVQQYPRGGGYMQEHIDPDSGQKAIFSTLLSKPGRDFFKGGLFYRDEKNNKIFMDDLLRPGDSFVFYPSASHGVDPVDNEITLDWSKIDGRWMCFSALVTASSLNGENDGTSGQAVMNVN